MNTNVVDQIENSIESEIGHLRSEYNQFTGGEKLKEAYRLAESATCDMVEALKSKATEVLADSKVQAGDVAAKAEGYVKERPLWTIGAAFAAGFLISKLVSK
jgi:ElaB/YqjD/DUF883 family membrane-anchored ribosome-binding protein